MTDIEKLIEKEKALAAYAGHDRVVHFVDYLGARQNERQKLKFHRSGFHQFDQKLDGLVTGEVTVISGKTGQGKTLFAESWIRSMMEADPTLRACVFSYEVSPEALLRKYADWPETPLFLPMSLRCMDVEWLKARVQEAKLKHDCQIFLFDHLHFLVDMQVAQNMSLNIGAFMRRLKQDIAIGLNVCPILIAHQKGGDKKEDASLDDIRDSTFIAQEADNVVMVGRTPDIKNSALLEMERSNPVLADNVKRRTNFMANPLDPFANQFATVQIAKARRSGTFRWLKLFQKVGHFLEEV